MPRHTKAVDIDRDAPLSVILQKLSEEPGGLEYLMESRHPEPGFRFLVRGHIGLVHHYMSEQDDAFALFKSAMADIKRRKGLAVIDAGEGL